MKGFALGLVFRGEMQVAESPIEGSCNTDQLVILNRFKDTASELACGAKREETRNQTKPERRSDREGFDPKFA